MLVLCGKCKATVDLDRESKRLVCFRKKDFIVVRKTSKMVVLDKHDFIVCESCYNELLELLRGKNNEVVQA